MIGLQIQIRPTGIKVRVKVDQARRDIEFAEVDHPLRVRRRQVLADLVNLVADDRDVKTAVALVVWVDHVPVLEQDVDDLLGGERRASQTEGKPDRGDGTSNESIHNLRTQWLRNLAVKESDPTRRLRPITGSPARLRQKQSRHCEPSSRPARGVNPSSYCPRHP